MGDWTYALPPIIIKGQGTASTWNMGSNYLPNILAMGMAFNQSLASWKYQNGGSTVSFSPVMHNGSAYMMGGDMFGFSDLLGILFSNVKPENQEAALGLAALAVITTKGRAAPGILKAEAGIVKTELAISKAEMNYTKSNLKLGQEMHKAYKAELADGINTVKEFRGVPGIRPDFVDFNTKTLYELKPFNPRNIKLGTKQLQNYKTLFEKKYGGEWNTVLDFY